MNVALMGMSPSEGAKTITLIGAQTGNYEAGMLSITGITGETITGLSTISSAGLFDPTFYSDALAIPSPVLSFTGDSINISFNVAGNPSPFGQFAYSGSGGQAIFSYSSVTADVPEPASWAMMIGGVGFAGGAMRRKRRVTISKIAFA